MGAREPGAGETKEHEGLTIPDGWTPRELRILRLLRDAIVMTRAQRAADKWIVVGTANDGISDGIRLLGIVGLLRILSDCHDAVVGELRDVCGNCRHLTTVQSREDGTFGCRFRDPHGEYPRLFVHLSQEGPRWCSLYERKAPPWSTGTGEDPSGECRDC